MHPVPYFMYVLGAVYSVVGALVLRQVFRPSCRVCLHRHSCPNREGDQPSEAAKPTCLGVGLANREV